MKSKNYAKLEKIAKYATVPSSISLKDSISIIAAASGSGSTSRSNIIFKSNKNNVIYNLSIGGHSFKKIRELIKSESFPVDAKIVMNFEDISKVIINDIHAGKSNDFIEIINKGISGVECSMSAYAKYNNFKLIEDAAREACNVAKTWMTEEEIKSLGE
jgi:hypothetical protein